MDRTNRNTALASALVEELARCGVRHACLSPGSRSTPLALALWRQPAIETTVLLDERCAGFFAVGAAQATGVPAVVLCTSGTAAANLHPSVIEANEAGVPLIVLTADRPPELRGVGAGQAIDQLKLYGSSVRWFCEVGTHEADDPGLIHMRATACRAYAAARGEPRPGPVHLNVPFRDPLAPVPRAGDVTATSDLALEGRGDRPLTAVTSSTPRADEALLDELAERISASPKGLIFAGRQTDPDLAAPVAALARAAGYPILAEPTSQLRSGSHDRDLVVWAYDSIARHRPEALTPELVIRFGDMPTSRPLRDWVGQIEGLRQIAIDPRFGWNEPSRTAEAIIRADPRAAASGLAERLRGGAGPGWAKAWLEAAAGAVGAIDSELDRLDRPTEPSVHRALGRLHGDGDLVYTASSMPVRDQEAFCESTPAEVRFLCNRGANGIDGLLSSGMGAAAASGRPTTIVTGDLGLAHDLNSLAALRRADTPVRVVVLDNRGGGIFDFLPQADALDEDEFEALLGTPSGLDISRVAELFELEHRRVESLGDLRPALAAGSGLIEVPVPDRKSNVGLHRKLSDAVGAALQASLRT